MWNGKACDAFLLQKSGLVEEIEDYLLPKRVGVLWFLFLFWASGFSVCCLPGQGSSLLVVSARRKNYLALCRAVADDRWHVLQEDG